MKRANQRAIAAAIAAGTIGIGLLAASPAGAAGNMRIGTYNTHFIVSPEGTADWATESEKDAAAAEMAARIVASDYDVLALNEVFDEDVRTILHNQTRSAYPYQVVKLYQRTGVFEDSGLMLLSKHPFVANPLQVDSADWAPKGNIYRNGDTSNMGTYVRFARYTSCEIPDCLADKGVGIVTIDIPVGVVPKRTTFLFTHLQAKGRTFRAAQFQTIRDLFAGLDYFAHFTKDTVFVLGDFNVQGDDQLPGSEWQERFNTDSGLSSWFALGGTAFRDAWFSEGFATDKGYTSTTTRDDHRLDYILKNSGALTPTSNLCNQHMSRAFNHQFGPFAISSTNGRFQTALRNAVPNGLAGSYNFSDHLGMNMELGFLNDHCSPLSATAATTLYGNGRYGVQPLVAADRNVQINTPILLPGAVSWYRIDSGPGAYAFALGSDTSPGSNIEIYHSSDFSRPVRSYKGDLYAQVNTAGAKVYSGRKFLFEKSAGVYYVKISLKDRAATGTVRWKHLLLHCGSTAQYCPVAANATYPRAIVMPANQGFPDAAGTGGTSVHAIDVPPLFSGASQTIVIGAIGAPSTSGMTLLVTDKNNALLGSTSTKISGDADCRDANGGNDTVCRKLTLTVTGPKRLYVYGIRANIANQESYYVFWKSPAVVVQGARRSNFDYLDLTAEDSKDGGGTSNNDELSMKVSLDGVAVMSDYAGFPLNSEFEDGETYWLDSFWAKFNLDRLFFKDVLHFRFNEEDDAFNGGDDHVNVDFLATDMVPAAGTASMGDDSAANHNVQRVFNLENDSSNSRYHMYLNASRGWGADCYAREDIGCHQSWQEWDMSLLFP